MSEEDTPLAARAKAPATFLSRAKRTIRLTERAMAMSQGSGAETPSVPKRTKKQNAEKAVVKGKAKTKSKGKGKGKGKEKAEELPAPEANGEITTQEDKATHSWLAPRATFCHQCRRSTHYDKMWCTAIKERSGKPCGLGYCDRCIDFRCAPPQCRASPPRSQ